MQFIFRIPSRFMTVFFGFDPCVTIYYEILFRKSELEWSFQFLFLKNLLRSVKDLKGKKIILRLYVLPTHMHEASKIEAYIDKFIQMIKF